jgi:hypothetical protein
VVVDREHTTVVGGKGDKRAIEGRYQELRKQIADTTSDYDREKLEERLAKLSGGVAVIRVGAPAEAEMKSRHEAFDDAIHATGAAVAEVIVPGAGLALLRVIPVVKQKLRRSTATSEPARRFCGGRSKLRRGPPFDQLHQLSRARGLSPNGQHRTRCSSHNLIGCRAKEHDVHRASPVDAYDDEIGLLILGDIENLAVRLPVPQTEGG